MRPLLLAAAVLLTAGPASAQVPSASPPAERDLSDLEALYWQRIEDNRKGTPADAAFMTGMIGHHAQALIMSEMAARNGASPAVQRLAARIDNAQRDEIESMQRWLRDRGHPVPQVHIDGIQLTIHLQEPEADAHAGMDHGAMDHAGMDHGDHEASETDHEGMDHGAMDHSAMGHGAGHDHSDMPGMLTDAQLAEMDAARGAEFDRLFLSYMIGHHEGAVIMVDDLFAQDGAAQDDDSFKLASDIQVDQRTEIARMQLMLDRLSD